jgi:ATP-dependent Lon protease
MTNLNDLDKKIKEVFPEESVFKSRENYSVFSGKNIPSFIKDWLIKKFIDDDGYVDKEALLTFLDKFIPRKDTITKIKGE